MIFKSSKINEFRLWGLLLTMIGMLVMIAGTGGILLWGRKGLVALSVFLFIGMLLMIASMAVYFWAGMLSTSAVSLDCPECGKRTKILGKTDRCMFCKTILSLDPAHAPPQVENRQ